MKKRGGSPFSTPTGTPNNSTPNGTPAATPKRLFYMTPTGTPKGTPKDTPKSSLARQEQSRSPFETPPNPKKRNASSSPKLVSKSPVFKIHVPKHNPIGSGKYGAVYDGRIEDIVPITDKPKEFYRLGPKTSYVTKVMTDSEQFKNDIERAFELNRKLAETEKQTFIIPNRVHEDKGRFYLEYPKANGTTIENIRDNSLDAEYVTKLFDKIVWLVHELHSRGIVHNDLTPENIIIDMQHDHISIIDFGNDNKDKSRDIKSVLEYITPHLADKIFITNDDRSKHIKRVFKYISALRNQSFLKDFEDFEADYNKKASKRMSYVAARGLFDD